MLLSTSAGFNVFFLCSLLNSNSFNFWIWSIWIFSIIEMFEHLHSFLSSVSSGYGDLVFRIQFVSHLQHVHHRSTSSKFVIWTSIVNAGNFKFHESSGAHYTWFYININCGLWQQFLLCTGDPFSLKIGGSI